MKDLKIIILLQNNIKNVPRWPPLFVGKDISLLVFQNRFPRTMNQFFVYISPFTPLGFGFGVDFGVGVSTSVQCLQFFTV